MWASVYALAEKLLDNYVKAIMVRTLYAVRAQIWSFGEISGKAVETIYESATAQRGMRQLLLDATAYCPHRGDTLEFRSALAQVPAEFLEDLACTTLDKLRNDATSDHQICYCHRASGGGWGDATSVCCCGQRLVRAEHTLDDYLDWDREESVGVETRDDHSGSPGNLEGYGLYQ